VADCLCFTPKIVMPTLVIYVDLDRSTPEEREEPPLLTETFFGNASLRVLGGSKPAAVSHVVGDVVRAVGDAALEVSLNESALLVVRDAVHQNLDGDGNAERTRGF
jgi:hypothetical protein